MRSTGSGYESGSLLDTFYFIFFEMEWQCPGDKFERFWRWRIRFAGLDQRGVLMAETWCVLGSRPGGDCSPGINIPLYLKRSK